MELKSCRLSMGLIPCCHVFWKAIHLWSTLWYPVSQVSPLPKFTLTRVNSLLKQKGEEKPSKKPKHWTINFFDNIAQYSRASRHLSSIAEEGEIQGGKRTWDKGKSLFKHITWGKNTVHDVPGDTSVMQTISRRFYLLESCFYLERNSSLGRVLGKGQCD